MMNSCASRCAIAVMAIASSAPNTPPTFGAIYRLRAAAAAPLSANGSRCLKAAFSRGAVCAATLIPQTCPLVRERSLDHRWRKRLNRAGRLEITDLAAAHFRAQFLGDMGGVNTVADDLRTDEDDQLRPRQSAPIAAAGVPEERDLIDDRDRAATSVLRLVDQSCQQNGLTARHH